MDKFKIKGKIFLGDEALGYSGVPVEIDLVNHLKSLNVSRFIFQYLDFPPFNGAFIPVGKDAYIVLINKERMKKYRLQLGDEIELFVEEDTSEYGMPLPDEMAIAFEEDPEGSLLFHKLTPGRMRTLLHIVGKFKSPDKRIEKSVIILEHLKANNGVLDFKMLNLAFKEYGKL